MKNKVFIVLAALALGVVAVIVSGIPAVKAYGNCTINSFYSSPSTVATGGYVTLMLGTSGCQNLTLSGGTYSNYNIGYGTSLQVGPLYSNTSYTVTGTDSYGNSTTASTTVSVGTTTGGACAVGSFYASPTQISPGGTATLYWNTTGCSGVTVTGPGINSSALSNTLTTPSLYNNSTYTLTATSLYGYSTSQSVTIFTNGSGGNGFGVTTSSAQSITDTSATLGGYIGANVCGSGYYCGYGTTYYFLYGTNQYSLYQQTATQTFSGTSGNVLAVVNNLQPNTTYYYKLVAANNGVLNSGTILSFSTTGYVTPVQQVSAITSVATLVTSSSARLNGVVTGTGGSVSAYFEYGTSPSFGSQTSSQNVQPYNVMNYYDTVSVSPNTTYYYRIVGVSNGQKFPGDMALFTTPGYSVYVPPTVINNPIQSSGFGGGLSYVTLSILNQSSSVLPGNQVNYLVNYQNISNEVLSGAIMNVILPKGVTFSGASQGMYTTDNTVAIALGVLPPGAQGTVTISTVANTATTVGNNFVATATLAFTLPSRAQDSAIAYSINNVMMGNNPNNLAGLALFGSGFFPNSLMGWILIILILIVLSMIVRYFYHRGNEQYAPSAPAAPVAPATHVYYNSPAPRNTDSVHHL